MSTARTPSWRTRETCRSTASPASCPHVSFTFLKWSMSISTSDTGWLYRSASASVRVKLLAEVHPVPQSGERIGARPPVHLGELPRHLQRSSDHGAEHGEGTRFVEGERAHLLRFQHERAENPAVLGQGNDGNGARGPNHAFGAIERLP